MEPRPKKLLDQLRDAIRFKHYAYRTEETYVQWFRRYILFHDKRHPNEMGRIEIEAFLTHLAVQEQVAASTQNQALNAILFLYREVLNLEVSDVNVRDELHDHLIRVKRQHQQDLGRGFGTVSLPYALDCKYPNANRDWIWQFVFPSSQIAKDPRGGLMCRHHLHESSVQSPYRVSVCIREALPKAVSTYRPFFPTSKNPDKEVCRYACIQQTFPLCCPILVFSSPENPVTPSVQGEVKR